VFASRANRACFVENAEAYLEDARVAGGLYESDERMLVSACTTCSNCVHAFMALGAVGFEWDDYLDALHFELEPCQQLSPIEAEVSRSHNNSMRGRKKELLYAVVMYASAAIMRDARDLLRLRLVGDRRLLQLATEAIPRLFLPRCYQQQEEWLQQARMAVQWTAPLAAGMTHRVRVAVMQMLRHDDSRSLGPLLAIGAFGSLEARRCVVSTINLFIGDLSAEGELCGRFQQLVRHLPPTRTTMKALRRAIRHAHFSRAYDFEAQAWTLK